MKALAHPLRVHILALLNERVASPNQLANQLGERLGDVSYHIKALKESDCIELVRTEPRRGAVEHFYRATKHAFFSDEDWEQLPMSVKPSMSANLLRDIVDDAMAAMEAGTFYARSDHHLSWTPTMLDEQGWREAVVAQMEFVERLLQIQAQSTERLAETGAEGFPASFALMGYETPSRVE
ncbi:MAG TPA: winged helix-turn-helix domain-containing protein [Solirubrobacterales bacterium]|nr:winged helix-turn-helix domain-containing protein [Solirubrobacterales bacterium]